MVRALIAAVEGCTDARDAKDSRRRQCDPLLRGRHAPGRFLTAPLESFQKLNNIQDIILWHVFRRRCAMRGMQVHPQAKGHWPEPRTSI